MLQDPAVMFAEEELLLLLFKEDILYDLLVLNKDYVMSLLSLGLDILLVESELSSKCSAILATQTSLCSGL